MRGAAKLVELRKQGKTPALVFLDADSERLPFADWDLVDPAGAPTNVMHMQPDAGERASRTDLRCLVGLTVYVSGLDAKRVHALRDAAIAAKAKRVIASVQQQVGHGEWIAFQTIEVTDTEQAWPN